MALAVKDANGTIQYEPLFDPAYRAAKASMAYTTAKDLIQIAGAANVIARVKRIAITLINGGTAGDLSFTLVKRSTLDSGDTPTATLTAVPLDSASAAAACTVTQRASTSWVGGTAVGTIGAVNLSTPGTVAGASTVFEWNFSNRGDNPPLLRSATEALCILVTNGGTTPTSATVSAEIQWEESTT